MVIPVVYWSGSGNTEKMAEAVAAAINEAGAEAKLAQVGDVTAAEIAQYDRIALGCSAMGAEVLEEYEFEPFMAELEGSLTGKKLALFGSYGWGGSYMEDWKTRCEGAGAEVVADGVLALSEPDEEALAACKALGGLLAK